MNQTIIVIFQYGARRFQTVVGLLSMIALYLPKSRIQSKDKHKL